MLTPKLSLGFGLATLMREPSMRKRRDLLAMGVDLGFTHLDVAPLYGLGRAEPELGAFLSTAALDSVTVSTKVGLTASPVARAIATVQGPMRAALRTFPALRSLAQRGAGSARTEVAPTRELIRASLMASLKRLQLEKVDYLLLHEVPSACVSDPVLDEAKLLIAEGRVGAFGVSGPASLMDSNVIDSNPTISVIQSNESLNPVVRSTRQDLKWINYGVLGGNIRHLRHAFDDRDLCRRAERLLGRPLRTDDDLARGLILMSCLSRPGSTVLIGSTRKEHIRAISGLLAEPLPSAGAASEARSLIFPHDIAQ